MTYSPISGVARIPIDSIATEFRKSDQRSAGMLRMKKPATREIVAGIRASDRRARASLGPQPDHEQPERRR